MKINKCIILLAACTLSIPLSAQTLTSYGDPSLERRDGFASDEKEKFCGFAFYPKKG